MERRHRNESHTCLTDPKGGYGADDGQAGKPRECTEGSWCNGFRAENASACAAACCAVKGSACGGYTFDPRQGDTSGGTRCPVGGPCCWLKQAPSALGKGPARFQGAVRPSEAPTNDMTIDTLEYSFGDSMVVAPIFSPVGPDGTVSKALWVPPGSWMRWQTGETFVGPLVSTQRFTQAETPVFVKVGSVLPLKRMESVHDVAPPVLVLQIVTSPRGASSGSTRVYEDDGTSLGYTTGAFRVLNCSQASNATHTAVHIAPHAAGAGYAGEPATRWYNVELVVGATTARPRRVTVAGQEVREAEAGGGRARGWWRSKFGPRGLPTLVVGTGAVGAGRALEVVVER